jgi:hypothetical protein
LNCYLVGEAARQAVMILRRVWTLIGNCCFAKV